MYKKIEKLLSFLSKKNSNLINLLKTQKMLLGNLNTIELTKKKNIKNLHEVEFKVFSQWGDDGIIQYLIQNLEIPNKTFIEFGVSNYTEANTRFLLINNNWSGLVMDNSIEDIDYIKNDEIYWKYDLQAKSEFLDTKNINDLIMSSGFSSDLGLLSIDIDGNDYWIWKAINCVAPIIVVIEYNSLFGQNNSWTTPYNPSFIRSKFHYSNLCYGSSLTSLCDLAEEKGYFFIGSNSSGNNAYFIRKDKISNIKTVTISEGYVLSKFKESRDTKGKLTFLRSNERLNKIKGIRVYDTRLKDFVIIN